MRIGNFRRQRALVAGALAALLCTGCGGGKLSAKALSQQAKTLQSVAAEGALLGQDAGSGKTTRTYAREQASDLYKAASQEESALRTAKTAPALEPKLRRLNTLADEASAALKRLGDASKDEQRRLARKLLAVAEQTKQIGDGL